ncbi:non-classical secretion pathway, nce2 component [Trichoderma arundinaceum]|uniref:Non-classical secretion pathway, nce2 component n=1 Tax=Trichoderma arundinaceum TaxID=490622 RepID=A0A395N9D2_TRIAR|nr:non-classical secretion pathway, nce2 component [Trichoderma arundinaceum]
MSNFFKVILRLIALVWTLLITALIGNVIASNNDGHMVTINFAMFVAALSWVALLYGLFAIFVESIALPTALLLLDGLATLFTFICAIVLAAKLRAPNCGNIPNDDLPSGWIGFGSNSDEKRCREIQASTAFMWFLWACFCLLLFITFRDARSMGFSAGSSRFSRSSRSSRPAMSQVSSAV